jgi:hypothetical protein
VSLLFVTLSGASSNSSVQSYFPGVTPQALREDAYLFRAMQQANSNRDVVSIQHAIWDIMGVFGAPLVPIPLPDPAENDAYWVAQAAKDAAAFDLPGYSVIVSTPAAPGGYPVRMEQAFMTQTPVPEPRVELLLAGGLVSLSILWRRWTRLQR